MASATRTGQGLLDEYLAFLERHRGLREATFYYHRRWGRRFLRHLATRCPHGDIGQLTIPIVDEFVRRWVRRVGRGTQSQLIQVVRGLLRHPHRTGRLAHDWSTCIQGPRRYRLATVPTTISREQVKQLLRSVDRRTAIGRRHYAMLLLLAVYGLRAREVVELRLDDVDWRARVLRIQRSKTGHPLVLPLTDAVAEALAAYLRRGRPHTEVREIFVRHDSAPVAFRKSSRLYAIVRHAFDQAHIASARRGPHVLRHALATDLVQRGFPLYAIGDVLGHQHPDSTLPYTKLGGVCDVDEGAENDRRGSRTPTACQMPRAVRGAPPGPPQARVPCPG